MVLDGKPSQEDSVNAGVSQGSILGPTLFLILHYSFLVLHINDLPDDVMCNTAICADGTTLYSKCDQVSDLWQQLELASELESNLRDTVDWGRKWLVDFNAVTIPKCDKCVYVNSFFPRTAILENFLPIECSPLTYVLVALSLQLTDIF